MLQIVQLVMHIMKIMLQIVRRAATCKTKEAGAQWTTIGLFLISILDFCKYWLEHRYYPFGGENNQICLLHALVSKWKSKITILTGPQHTVSLALRLFSCWPLDIFGPFSNLFLCFEFNIDCMLICLRLVLSHIFAWEEKNLNINSNLQKHRSIVLLSDWVSVCSLVMTINWNPQESFCFHLVEWMCRAIQSH